MTINASPSTQGLNRTGATTAAAGSTSGIFVFEADTAAFANRKRAARACVNCQKRKKRCPHTFSRSQDDGGTGSGGANATDGAEKILPNLIHKEPIQFVGDLNPESILTDLSTSERGANTTRRIGTWVEQSRLRADLDSARTTTPALNGTGSGNGLVPEQVARPNQPTGSSLRQAVVDRYSKIERGRRTLTGHQKNYLQAVGAFRVLPKSTEEVLVTTYIACIDSLLPIIDGKKFLAEYTAGEASVFLVQAICLVACKTEEAIPYLRLYEDGPLLDPIPFARSLHTGLDAAMKADLEADRFTKVQIMTLMSLHNDGPGGIEESSLHLVQAIHDAQTTGVHIDTPGRTRNDQGAQLWWTLWTLDKYNACLGGRPLMIAERDIDILEPEREGNARSQNLAVWSALGHLLDKVIEFYRPIADPNATGWEKDFPTWETLTANCDLEMSSASDRNVLEICYNIIGILACRSGGPVTRSYNRRIECADRIQILVAKGRHVHLAPIPLVPYAVSLSLTVVYRSLRDHHTDQSKGIADLATRCDILESLSKTWWTADAMAKLGRKALKSLQHPLQPHQKNRIQDLGPSLDVAVAACKYGPFSERKLGQTTRVDPSTPGDGTERYTEAQLGRPGNLNAVGNALHLLSDAAATYGQRKAQMKPKRLMTAAKNTEANKRLLAAEQNTENELQAKRRRLKPGRHPNAGLDHLTPSSTNSTTTPTATGPATMALPQTDSTLISSSSATDVQQSQPFIPSAATGSTPTPTDSTTPSTAFDMSLQRLNSISMRPGTAHSLGIDPFPTFADYSDLDNLFEGFFDLSMPTMFQDPLFDGASYLDDVGAAGAGGPGGGGTFDDYGFIGGAVPEAIQYGGAPAGATITDAANGNPGVQLNAATIIDNKGVGQIDPRINGLSVDTMEFGLQGPR